MMVQNDLMKHWNLQGLEKHDHKIHGPEVSFEDWNYRDKAVRQSNNSSIDANLYFHIFIISFYEYKFNPQTYKYRYLI